MTILLVSVPMCSEIFGIKFALILFMGELLVILLETFEGYD